MQEHSLSNLIYPNLLLPLACHGSIPQRCLKKFQGGVLMISHDMRLISQCAEQIYICDHKKIELYKGDILNFKLASRKANQKKLAQHMNG